MFPGSKKLYHRRISLMELFTSGSVFIVSSWNFLSYLELILEDTLKGLLYFVSYTISIWSWKWISQEFIGSTLFCYLRVESVLGREIFWWWHLKQFLYFVSILETLKASTLFSCNLVTLKAYTLFRNQFQKFLHVW